MNAMNQLPPTKERALHILEKGSQPKRARPSVVFAAIGTDIKFDPHIFDSYCYEGWKNIHHDLLLISAAVEYADRRWSRSVRKWSRSIHITIPVFELTVWQNAKVQRSLVDTLRHLTGDLWRFSFLRNEGKAICEGRQRPLFPNQPKEFSMAYSDGLDSRCIAGLFNNENDIAVCVRVSKNQPHIRKSERPFDRVPFDVNVNESTEDSVRSRGFKFAAITAIASHLAGVSRIIVPESGQGALGPVLLPLRGIYPDYRNHPTFFRYMENFISALLDIDLRYEQPHLWHTKGQTVEAFLAMPGIDPEHVKDTHSCWQQRFNVCIDGQRRQCGICAACLLRRMSLYAAGVTENPQTYTITDLQAGSYAEAMPPRFRATRTLFEYGCIGARHLQQLADLANASDSALKAHAFELGQALGISVDSTLLQLKTMLSQHRREWNSFLNSQGENSFLNMWTKGGRHG